MRNVSKLKAIGAFNIPVYHWVAAQILHLADMSIKKHTSQQCCQMCHYTLGTSYLPQKLFRAPFWTNRGVHSVDIWREQLQFGMSLFTDVSTKVDNFITKPPSFLFLLLWLAKSGSCVRGLGWGGGQQSGCSWCTSHFYSSVSWWYSTNSRCWRHHWRLQKCKMKFPKSINIIQEKPEVRLAHK
jgi:hypothetical protein